MCAHQTLSQRSFSPGHPLKHVWLLPSYCLLSSLLVAASDPPGLGWQVEAGKEDRGVSRSGVTDGSFLVLPFTDPPTEDHPLHSLGHSSLLPSLPLVFWHRPFVPYRWSSPQLLIFKNSSVSTPSSEGISPPSSPCPRPLQSGVQRWGTWACMHTLDVRFKQAAGYLCLGFCFGMGWARRKWNLESQRRPRGKGRYTENPVHSSKIF